MPPLARPAACFFFLISTTLVEHASAVLHSRSAGPADKASPLKPASSVSWSKSASNVTSAAKSNSSAVVSSVKKLAGNVSSSNKAGNKSSETPRIVTTLINDGIPLKPWSVSDRQNVVVLTKPYLESQQSDIFMRYMPREDVVLCGCGKCGSTSMLQYVYDQVFPRTWTEQYDGLGAPFVQEVTSPRWEGRFRMVHNQTKQDNIMSRKGPTFSFALIRDPKERLVSAWKSKLACDNDYGVDQYDRAHFDRRKHVYTGFVHHIQALSGGDTNVTCLTLRQFAQALVEIKKLGRQQYLDRHFLPQDLGCFYRYPPSKWSKVTTIDNPRAFKKLGQHLNSTNISVPDYHASPKKTLVAPAVANLLDEATKDEYAMLTPYLKRPSRVEAGSLALVSALRLRGTAVQKDTSELVEVAA